MRLSLDIGGLKLDGGYHGILAIGSTLCALVNGFTGHSKHSHGVSVVWPGIFPNTRLVKLFSFSVFFKRIISFSFYFVPSPIQINFILQFFRNLSRELFFEWLFLLIFTRFFHKISPIVLSTKKV